MNDALREETGVVFEFGLRSHYDNIIEVIRQHLDETSFNEAWEEGRKMTLDEAVEYALGDN